MAYKYDPQVAKQQTDLNAANQGKAGYVPLKVDGLLGPLTQGAIQKYGFNTQTGQPNTPLGGLKTEEDIKTEPTSNLGNLRKSLNEALTEAAQTRSDSRLTQLSGLMGGGADPSVLKAAMGLARSGLAQSRESIFEEAMEGYKAKYEQENKLLSVSDAKELGLPFGTTMSEAARRGIIPKKGDSETTRQNTITQQAFAKADAYFNQLKQKSSSNPEWDGYIDSKEYMRLRTDFISAGKGTAGQFDDAFSPNLSPKDRARLGIGKSVGVQADDDSNPFE